MFARILGRFFKINPSFPFFISFVLLRWKILLWRKVGDMINCFRERCINWFGWKIKSKNPRIRRSKIIYLLVIIVLLFEWELSYWKFLRLSKYRNWSNNKTKHRKVFSFFFLKVRLSRFLFSPYFKDFFLSTWLPRIWMDEFCCLCDSFSLSIFLHFYLPSNFYHYLLSFLFFKSYLSSEKFFSELFFFHRFRIEIIVKIK